MTDSSVEFTTTEVQKLFAINRNTINDWLARGFIKPSIKKANRGYSHIFSLDDLYTIRIFWSLQYLGLNRWYASKYSLDKSYLDNYNSLVSISGIEIKVDKGKIKGFINRLIKRRLGRDIQKETRAQQGE